MAIGIGTFAETGSATNANSYTHSSYTPPANDRMVLVVGVATEDAADQTDNIVCTFGGTSMTLIAQANVAAANDAYCALFGLALASDNTAGNIVASTVAEDQLNACCIMAGTISDTSQTLPTNTAVSEVDATSVNTTLTGVTIGDIVVNVCCCENETQTYTPTQGDQVDDLTSTATGDNEGRMTHIVATATSETAGFSTGGFTRRLANIVVNFAEDTGGGAVFTPRLSLLGVG